MDSFLAMQKPKCFLMIMLMLQLAFCIAVIFNIPIARQIIGFFYLTFVPGFVVTKLLKMKADRLETALFSVGLSVAFVMLVGLLINEVCPLLGIMRPLSLTPVIIVFTSLVLAGIIAAYVRSDDTELNRNRPAVFVPLIFLFVAILALSVVGALWVNMYGNNTLLLIMITMVSSMFVVGVLSRKLLHTGYYPIAVLIIAVALLFHSSLISNYIIHFGSDVTGEYFVLKTVENNAHWGLDDPFLLQAWEGFGRLNSMLSISILPTVYSNLLSVDSAWIFKALFPAIFSLVPLGLYKIWTKSFGRKYAFISAFLFMAQASFYTEMLGLCRQMIAELFFVLLVLVIINKTMKSVNRVLLFMTFSFALVVSHYAVAEIFLFFVFLTLVYLMVLKRHSKIVTASMVTFFITVMFFWYIYTSNSAVFDSFIGFGNYVYQQLGDFFDLSSRGQTVLQGLGVEAPPTIWNMTSRVFAYLTQVFIVIGFFGLVLKRVKIHLDTEYFTLTLFSVTLLVALVAVPGLANTLNMTRFYHILLFFLAPLCALGVETVTRLISKRKPEVMSSALLLIVLVPYFLFQTGFVYEIAASDSFSIPLSGYRMNTVRLYGALGYTEAYSVFGSRWLSDNIDVRYSRIYADYYARSELRGYAMAHMDHIEILSNTTRVANGGVVYLSPITSIEGIVVGVRYQWNRSDLHFLSDLNNVYSNGRVSIYTKPP